MRRWTEVPVCEGKNGISETWSESIKFLGRILRQNKVSILAGTISLHNYRLGETRFSVYLSGNPNVSRKPLLITALSQVLFLPCGHCQRACAEQTVPASSECQTGEAWAHEENVGLRQRAVQVVSAEPAKPEASSSCHVTVTVATRDIRADYSS